MRGFFFFFFLVNRLEYLNIVYVIFRRPVKEITEETNTTCFFTGSFVTLSKMALLKLIKLHLYY